MVELTCGPTTPPGPGGPVFPWNPWNHKNMERKPSFWLVFTIVKCCLRSACASSKPFLKLLWSLCSLLTGSPLWPGWPGSPSFPAGPYTHIHRYTQKNTHEHMRDASDCSQHFVFGPVIISNAVTVSRPSGSSGWFTAIYTFNRKPVNENTIYWSDAE